MIGPVAITRGASAPGIIRGFAPYSLGEGEDAVLCVHGISGSPAHFREMAEYMAAAGFHVRGTLLPGHGTKAEHLRHVTWQDWYDHCAAEVSLLRESHRAVHVVGYSIGAALALQLAAEQVAVDRLVLLSVPLNPRQSATLMRLVFGLHAKLFSRFHANPPRFVDDTGQEFYYVYKTSPSTIYRTMLDLMVSTKHRVSEVENPTLLIHSQTDKSSGRHSGRWTYQQLRAENKRLIALGKSDHAVMLDSDRYRVFTETVQFLGGVATSAAAEESHAVA